MFENGISMLTVLFPMSAYIFGTYSALLFGKVNQLHMRQNNNTVNTLLADTSMKIIFT
jgi:hypothetical protein